MRVEGVGRDSIQGDVRFTEVLERMGARFEGGGGVTAVEVNLKFIFDGEEEIGSPFFGSLTEKHKDLLKADLVLVTDGPKHGSGRPTISFGARGVLKFEMTIESARRDLHSGNFAAPNPNWRLAGLLSSMAAPDGTPLIEGFEDGVAPPTKAERELMASFPLDLHALERELGVGLPEDYLEKVMFHPTLTIRGLQSGFVGAEANTVIPHKTTVAIDIRMVKNQKIETVYTRVIEHIRSQGFEVIEGADLRQYVDGDKPIPTPEEARARLAESGDGRRVPSGPDIIGQPQAQMAAPAGPWPPNTDRRSARCERSAVPASTSSTWQPGSASTSRDTSWSRPRNQRALLARSRVESRASTGREPSWSTTSTS